MNFNTDYKLENYILDTAWEMLPEAVRQRALVCAVDLMMALIIGSKGRQFLTGQDVAREIGCLGSIPVIGSNQTYNLFGATLVMSHAANSFDIDDGHNMIKGHPGASFIAGVLAAALKEDISCREFLTTLVVAYDVAVRAGLALQRHYDYLHSTGAYGAVATAAGISRILGFSKGQLNNALSIADFHAPMTPVMRAVEYPSMNKDGVPFGAMTGILAVLETLAGYTGKTHLLELDEHRDLLETLGTEFEIMNLYFKPYTCCRWAHQPIKACQDLMAEHPFTARQIRSVTVHTFAAAARLSRKIPEKTDEAQYNIAFPVAAGLVHGDVGYLQICDEALRNPEVLAMMGRLDFVVDPALDAQFPEKRLAWVEIELDDQTVLKSTICAAPGEAADQVDLDWIQKKFLRVTAPILDPAAQRKVLAVLQDFIHLDVSTIVREINAASSSGLIAAG